MVRRILLKSVLVATVVASVTSSLWALPKDEDTTATKASDAASTEGITQVYVVPMNGQFGTDILPELYTSICEDIKKVDPDVIVFRLRTGPLSSADEFQDIIEGDRNSKPRGNDKTDWNLLRDLRRQFAIELVDYKQVLWVENANGFISPMAFGWKDMVMSPDATIGNMVIWFQMAAGSANGENMFGKYFDAMLGTIEGVAERGGWTHPDRWPLLDAMTDPRQVLSTTWVGRKAIFYPNSRGDFVLDNSGEGPLFSLTASQAEDLLITRGVVSDMEDLSILMGWPRYAIAKDASDVINKHREHWRALLERARGAWRAFQEGRGEGDLPGLSTALRALRRIVSIERSNPAMPFALQTNGMLSGIRLQVLIELIEDEIKRMQAGGGRGGGGGGLGGGGVGPGGPRPGG